MQVEIWGSGSRVILIHGAITNGLAAWSKQRPLSESWQLVVVNRPGFAPNPPAARCDFEPDARAISALLAEPAHVVGHSYGGLIALLAASFEPDSVRSLAVIEPPVMSLLRGDPEVEEAIDRHLELLHLHREDPRGFLAAFTASIGGNPASVPESLPAPLQQHVELLINERFPWEATVPVATLAGVRFPKLVLSGGHSTMQERMCDVLAATISAGRETITGAAHRVQSAPGCNEVLDRFWREGEAD
jgi:pimeloyl-ACP methyl ester carboxylesterase